MSNTKSIENNNNNNNNSDLIQGPCPVNQSEELDIAIDKDELIALAKKFIESAEFDFINKPISETCRFLSLKNMTVIEPRDHHNASKEIADIVEKVFDEYLANEISKRERRLFEKKFANQKSVSTVKKYDSNRDIFVIDNEEHQEPLERTCKSEEVIAAVKKIASGYIYNTEWSKNGDPSVEHEKLQYLESQARDEVTRLYGLDDELLDTVSSEFKEFYKHHPTIFFPTKPSERTCENEDVTSAVKKLAVERLERFKFQANEDPEDAYERLKYIESQVKDDVTSIYGKNYELLDVVTNVFEEFYEVHSYNFFTGNKEPKEITDPVCASEDADEKEEAMELACDIEDTDAKPEESPEKELMDITDLPTPDKKAAKVTKIADECVKNIRFGPDEGELVDLLRVVDAERKAASRVYELYGEDRDAIEELYKFFKRCYEAVERFHYCGFKEKALVMPEQAGRTEILDRIYNSISRIVKECMSGAELEYNDGSDYDVTLVKKVSHDIQSKVTEMFGDNKAIQSFANDIFRDRLAGAPKVESTTVPAESSGKEIENLITKIYGERSRKNLPKESQEQSEQKDEPTFFDSKMSLGLARRIWKEHPFYGSNENIVEPLLDRFFPDKVYKRPYKYGAVVTDELNMYDSLSSCSGYDDNKELSSFYAVNKYYNNWIDNYYGEDVKREESDLKFSIHRVHPEPDKYDYVVIENSHSTRPLSFPTKDMADNFLIVFRDLIEAAGNLI